MANYLQVVDILNQLSFRDWRFQIRPTQEHILLRVVFSAPDAFNKGKPTEQQGRWWVIEPHNTDEEVVKTAFAAVKMAMEHEVREDFVYKGKRPFSPHKKV